jgi:signal transduction histidine kinase
MIAWQHAFRNRVERIIGLGRVALALFALFAIWLDPSQPAYFAQHTYVLLILFVVYAMIAALVSWRTDSPIARWGLVTHLSDLAIFALLMYLTEGPTSPFFVFFTFSLLAAHLRWQWRGTVWTAYAVLVVLVAFGILAGKTLSGPGFELNRFIILGIYLTVAAIMLAYVGAYQEAIRKELWQLATGPPGLLHAGEAPIRDVVEYAAGVFGAPRVVMAWSEGEEPWLNLATWSARGLEESRESPAAYDPLVAERLADGGFLCWDAGDEHATVVYGEAGDFWRCHGVPLHPGFRARFQIKSVLSLRLASQSVDGWLFVLDKPDLTTDHLLVAEVVAGQVAARMDQYDLVRTLQEAAANDERMRVARDLHDGVLQSLTATALQLKTTSQLLKREPRAAARHLQEMQSALAERQRELRAFIQQLKPGLVPVKTPDFGLADQLRVLADRLSDSWGLKVDWSVDPPGVRVSGALAQQIAWMIGEGAANAKRHGRSSGIDIKVQARDGWVTIAIGDDGRGFPFHGYYDHDALVRGDHGPATLRDRIASLGGRLAIDSRAGGARLDISLPLATEGTADAH